jgi:hypothetical protein
MIASPRVEFEGDRQDEKEPEKTGKEENSAAHNAGSLLALYGRAAYRAPSEITTSRY